MLDARERQPEMDRQSDYKKEPSAAAMQWDSNNSTTTTTNCNNNSIDTMPLGTSSLLTSSGSSSTIVSASVSVDVGNSSSAEVTVASISDEAAKPGDAQIPIRQHEITTTTTTMTAAHHHEVPPQRPALRTGRWTPDEKILFLYGLRMFGKGRWKKMSVYLPQRSLVQIKSHAQKVLKRQQAGENIFRRLEENYNEIDNLVVQAARQRDALRIAGVKVHTPTTSTSASKCATATTKKKRLHNNHDRNHSHNHSLNHSHNHNHNHSPTTGHTGTPAPVPQEFLLHQTPQTPDSSVLAAAALCQLSSIGGNWDKRENKNTINGKDQQTAL